MGGILARVGSELGRRRGERLRRTLLDFPTVVLVEVTVVATTFGVVGEVGVGAFPCLRFTRGLVVAGAAHVLRVMLPFCMRACCDHLDFPVDRSIYRPCKR